MMKAVMKNGSVFAKVDVPPSTRKISVCHSTESGNPVSNYELKISASKRNTGCWMFQHAPVAELLPCGTYFIKHEVSDKKITTEEEVAKKLKEIINIDPYLEVHGGRDLLDFLGIFVETDDGKSQLRYGLTRDFISRFLSITKLPHKVILLKLQDIEKNLLLMVKDKLAEAVSQQPSFVHRGNEK